MTVIIGIDPGSRYTGYGVIRCEKNQNTYLDSGYLRLTESSSALRLQKIFSELQKIIQLYQPQEAAIEQIFMHQNPGSALKLGQARGAAIVALNMPVTEYSARQIKQSVVGLGGASKIQVQHMVRQLLNISDKLQADAADALAIALCHAHTQYSLQKMGFITTHKKKRSSWRDFKMNEV